MVSPESRAIRKRFICNGEYIKMPYETQRRQWEQAALKEQLPSDVIVQTVTVKGVPAEYVYFSGSVCSQVILYLHGGGFTQGSCITHRKLAAHIALKLEMRVLVADYRLAPENPFPAALEDAVKAYCWLLEEGVKSRDIIIGGDSSGGGLAVALMLYLREHNIDLPKATFLISPWLDMTFKGESLMSRKNVDPLVLEEDIKNDAKEYCGDHNPINPYISPVYGNLKGLPPFLIQTGDYEILLSDSIRISENARKDGVSVQLDIWDEMWHVWHAWLEELPEARDAIKEIDRFIKSL